jgi:hypothetical protein
MGGAGIAKERRKGKRPTTQKLRLTRSDEETSI